MALIEIDGLPFLKMGGSFHIVSHNQMVAGILDLGIGEFENRMAFGENQTVSPRNIIDNEYITILYI